MDNIRIAFHGTDEKTAQIILQEGFRDGTFFALDLADALEFGGHHVFYVEFVDNPWFDEMISIGGGTRKIRRWQFTHSKIPASKIRRYVVFNPEVKFLAKG